MKKFGYLLLVFIIVSPYILFSQTKQDTVNWIKEYALKGEDEFILVLADCFVEGYGVEKNLDSAIYWYKKIKKEELQKEKLYNLGYVYIKKKEYKNAINILNNSILYNFDSAMFNLSFCYSKIGEYGYAYHFMKKASKLGMKDANLALSDALRKYNESIEERNKQIRDSNPKAEEMESKNNNSLLYTVIFIVIIIGIIIFWTGNSGEKKYMRLSALWCIVGFVSTYILQERNSIFTMAITFGGFLFIKGLKKFCR